MFTQIIKTTALIAMVAVGTAGVSATQASAANVGIEFQIGGFGNGHGHGPRWGHGHNRGPNWGNRGSCRPQRAVRKASNMGVRHARVIRANNQRVVVKGWKRGSPTRVIFANRQHCPVIARR
tara:strand:- start:6534 stop:6899 length:366 start_codon:yes stop_codon:yes gene_type:complete